MSLHIWTIQTYDERDCKVLKSLADSVRVADAGLKCLYHLTSFLMSRLVTAVLACEAGSWSFQNP